MYYPSLKVLKNEGIDGNLIDTFDTWLGKLKGPKRKRIRPARFAVDKHINYDLANELFILGVEKAKIFELNYEIFCPCEQQELIKVVNNFEDIPTKTRCRACKEYFNPYDHDEYILLTFNLITNPDPNTYKGKNSNIKTDIYKTKTDFRKRRSVGRTSSLNIKTFFSTEEGQNKLLKTLFQPNWTQYDDAYNNFIRSFNSDTSTEEKGKALEELSRLLMSFITFFDVDTTVSTVTNQIDLTVRIKPYFKYIEIPILSVLNRRLICECKNEDKNVPSIWVDKLCSVIQKTDFCRAGIIFSRLPFSGEDYKNARASQLEHARNGYYIISFDKEDFKKIKEEKPFLLNYLDEKYEELEMRYRPKTS
ncbi:hypothetical protein [Bacillus velezensis]|uniref:hypothetical protein n=1 Tax=Bacillus velezensis TaxID=492670 RepID=UPI001623750E|nr:hypothetical protein [Bacillus velezensis]MBC2596641.1 hypothetical protein [Bacillus velezensis]